MSAVPGFVSDLKLSSTLPGKDKLSNLIRLSMNVSIVGGMKKSTRNDHFEGGLWTIKSGFQKT